MAHINKWIYSWTLYVNYGNGWNYYEKVYTHKDYKQYRKFYNEYRFISKWVENRKPNPDYKEN